MQIILTVIAGPHKGLEFAFDRHDTFLVGRSQHAHFQLPAKDKYFSRIHFMMEVNPPQCRLIDMGSHNGTYVNGVQILTPDLKDGDQIRAGHTILRVQVKQAAASAGQRRRRSAFNRRKRRPPTRCRRFRATSWNASWGEAPWG